MSGIVGHRGLLLSGSGGASDASYAQRVLGLHMDGADAGTSFPDHSPNPKTLTNNGGITTQTTTRVFGSAAAIFNQSSNYFSVASQADVTFGTGDLGIGGWFRHVNGGAVDMSLFTFASQNWNVFVDNTVGGGNAVKFWDGGAERIVGAVMAADTWTHVWLSRSSTTVRLFVGGVMATTFTDTGPTNLGAAAFHIGWYRTPDTSYLNGFVDDFLAYKGAAIYTANFTPPVNTFANS